MTKTKNGDTWSDRFNGDAMERDAASEQNKKFEGETSKGKGI